MRSITIFPESWKNSPDAGLGPGDPLNFQVLWGFLNYNV